MSRSAALFAALLRVAAADLAATCDDLPWADPDVHMPGDGGTNRACVVLCTTDLSI